MKVRQVRADEHEETGRVCVAAYRALPGAHMSGDYAAELADVAGRVAGATVLVAVEDGAVLGTVTYVDDPGSRWAEGLVTREAGVRMLAVAPGAQRRGIGAALLGACTARARDAGAARVVLHSTPWMTGAHALYVRAGFRRAPGRDLLPVPDVPLLAFELELRDA